MMILYMMLTYTVLFIGQGREVSRAGKLGENYGIGLEWTEGKNISWNSQGTYHHARNWEEFFNELLEMEELAWNQPGLERGLGNISEKKQLKRVWKKVFLYTRLKLYQERDIALSYRNAKCTIYYYVVQVVPWDVSQPKCYIPISSYYSTMGTKSQGHFGKWKNWPTS